VTLPIVSVRSHLRPTGIVIVSLTTTILVALHEGSAGLIGGLIITSVAVGVSLTTVARMTVFPNHLDLRIGPFGIVRRQLSRDEAILDGVDSLFIRTLIIDTTSGSLLGPISRVRLWDRWPESLLREVGYRFRT
jgi:hypothetical protein